MVMFPKRVPENPVFGFLGKRSGNGASEFSTVFAENELCGV